ncbi:MAG: translation initiation factor IF-2 subunit gamma [Thermofilaceae archaeon]|nr:translation initiation factor IF-2 subunit gamma [Thermofilaceae archaeon]
MEKVQKQELLQPLVNIGTAGHVDHGKTTLVEAITGIWTSRYSEELKRGITIKLGYADTTVIKCPSCSPPQAYYTSATAPPNGRCKYCNSELKPVRKISFVDVPGHEMLMAIMLAGTAIMDGVLLVIDASQPCPRPQTREHFMALALSGIKNIIVVQNKVDIVTKERAIESYEEIREFLKGTWVEKAPIIPVSALHRVNIDTLIWAIEEYIPTPSREVNVSPLMFVARSFDVNKPGTPVEDLKGGVLGGMIVQGIFEVGQEIEIRPGIKVSMKRGEVRYEPIVTEITSLKSGDQDIEIAYPGGLVGVGTKLDPSLTKGDSMMGNVVGHPDAMPPLLNQIGLEYALLERVVGVEKETRIEPLRKGEPLMLNVGTAVTIGIVSSLSGDTANLTLRSPIAAYPGTRVAISRQIEGRWRLIGYGRIS